MPDPVGIDQIAFYDSCEDDWIKKLVPARRFLSLPFIDKEIICAFKPSTFFPRKIP